MAGRGGFPAWLVPQAALDKTALKEAILDHIVGLRQATVEPLTAPDGAMVGHSGLSLLHLIPEQDLSRLYSAITAAARDSAPPTPLPLPACALGEFGAMVQRNSRPPTKPVLSCLLCAAVSDVRHSE